MLRDVIAASIPAVVALVVVWIGGKQTSERQRREFEANEERWERDRELERRRFERGERRALYADYLNALEKSVYHITHCLGHVNPEHPAECGDDLLAAVHDWMIVDQELNRLLGDVFLIGSLDFYFMARDIHDLIIELGVTYPSQEAMESWFHGEDGTPPGPALEHFQDLKLQLMMTARDDVNGRSRSDEEYFESERSSDGMLPDHR